MSTEIGLKLKTAITSVIKINGYFAFEIGLNFYGGEIDFLIDRQEFSYVPRTNAVIEFDFR